MFQCSVAADAVSADGVVNMVSRGLALCDVDCSGLVYRRLIADWRAVTWLAMQWHVVSWQVLLWLCCSLV